MQVLDPDGVKIYNLSAGKKLPDFLSDRQKRQLNKQDGAPCQADIVAAARRQCCASPQFPPLTLPTMA